MSRHQLLLLAIVSVACTQPDASANELAASAPRPVVVLPVEERPLTPSISASGTIAGKEEVNLAFKIGGVVSRVLVEPGQVVVAGQVLAELSPDEIAAAAGKAREARVKAQRDLDRVRTLHNDSVATRVQLDDATTALRLAEEDARAVEFNRSHAVIRAPAAGVVLRRHLEPGQMASAASPVIAMRTNRRGLVLHVGLIDRDVVRLRVGDRASIDLDAYPGRTFTARVATLPAAASPGSGTFDVELALDPTAEPLASGLIGRAEIAAQSSGVYPVLPLDALVEADGDSAIVFVVPPGSDRAERRTIHIAHLAPGAVAASSGIHAGELVVVRGGAWLNDGTLVRVTPAHGAAR
jgi:RND family efflux transporter MFP subunit